MRRPSLSSFWRTRASIDLDDGPFDNVAVVEVFDGLVDRGEEGLLRTDVVDRHLGCRTGLRAARHVWVGSGGHNVVGRAPPPAPLVEGQQVHWICLADLTS